MPNAIVNLKQAGCLDNPETSRVVVEEAFGHDYKSADHLQSVVALTPTPRKHRSIALTVSLGKDTVNNILSATRFKQHSSGEPLWNRQYIEEVQSLQPKLLVVKVGLNTMRRWCCRGYASKPYASSSCIDMPMEPPCANMTAKEIRRRKQRFLLQLRLGKKLVCGQYRIL